MKAAPGSTAEAIDAYQREIARSFQDKIRKMLGIKTITEYTKQTKETP